MSALTDLQAAVAENTSLVQQLIAAQGTPDVELVPVTAAVVASNDAIKAELNPPPAP